MMRALCVAAVLLSAAAVVLPAQRNRDRDFGLSQDEWCRDERRADFCEVREQTIPNGNTVYLDARGNGGVAVRGWDRSETRVRARITVWDDSREAAERLAKEIRITTSGGRIRADGPERDRNRNRRRDRRDDERWWTVAYELQVPRKADLSVDATNGGINVEDVRGRIDAHTVNGGIQLNDVGGDIRGETVNGGLHVELGGERWDGPGLDLKTVNGGVTLRVPSNFSGELDARTANGGISVDFPITISGLINNRRQITGTLGSGGPRLRLSAVNGGITIARR
jgi:hypothetical protein